MIIRKSRRIYAYNKAIFFYENLKNYHKPTGICVVLGDILYKKSGGYESSNCKWIWWENLLWYFPELRKFNEPIHSSSTKEGIQERINILKQCI